MSGGHGDDELLAALISPRSVALVGASGTAGKLTARPQQFLARQNFAGAVYPVNRGRSTIFDLPSFGSVAEIPDRVEHVYIMLDTEPAMAALEDCARSGVKVVSMLADGFAEAGPEGMARQERLVALAREAGMLLVGPNSTGVVGTAAGFCCTTNAAFRVDAIEKGNLAVISQSGSIIGTILSRGRALGAAFSSFVSVGNEAAAGVGAIGQLLLRDPDTKGVLLFLETIRHRDALAQFAAQASEMGKPVVAYIVGRSEEGQALSVSHTGALTGSVRAVSAFLREIGIHQVDQFEALIDAPRVMSAIKLDARRPRNVTVLSTTGGGGAMVVDQLSARGVAIGKCSAAARQHLGAAGIPLGRGKLVDVTLAGTKYETMKEVVSTLIADPETGMLVVAIGSSAQFNPELSVRPIVDAVGEALDDAAPVVAFPLPHAPESLAMLEAGGVPAFRNVETCAETVALLFKDERRRAVSTVDKSAEATELLASHAQGILDEVDAGGVFAAFDIARPPFVVLPPEGEVPDDLGLTFPVVAKLVSPDLPHKTEMGAIRIDIPDRSTLIEAIAVMRASAEARKPGHRLKGILVQEHLRGLGEVLIGISRDALVGPIVTVGMGGMLAEIYRDTALRPAPVSVEVASEMLSEVHGLAVLRGYRNKPLGDLDALARAVSAVSRLALHDDVVEAEINPVLVRGAGEGVFMLDALIVKG